MSLVSLVGKLILLISNDSTTRLRVTYSGDVGGVRPGVVGNINDDRSVGLVTSEKDRSSVESTIDEPVNTGYVGHPDSDILVLL
jgi:hypothetical protein